MAHSSIPRRHALVRARGLAAFREALCALATTGEPSAIRRRLVLVPTQAAALVLRQSIEQRLGQGGASAVVLPEFVTRDGWLRRLHALAGTRRPWLTRAEREVLFERATREVARRRRRPPPFRVRPGLLATVLDFYDELQRRQRSTRRFARAVFDDLRVERGTDRGSEQLIAQTCFLGFAFLAYERGVESSGGLDEHAFRKMLLAGHAQAPVDELVIAVADHPADPDGLWPADFDLAGRMRGLSSVQVVMTDEAHDAGFRARVEAELPGIEEIRWPDVPRAPVVLPPPGSTDALVHVSRDREEELREVARRLRADAARAGGELPGPVAIVFHRPLPYLYLAQQVLAEAQIPYQAFDARPLAAEPYAALLDLVLTLARTGGTREAAGELLRSRLFAVAVDGVGVGRDDAAALEAILVERRATGDAASYEGEVTAWVRSGSRGLDVTGASRAARALAELNRALEPYRTGETASEQVAALDAVLRAHTTAPVAAARGPAAERLRRARAALLSVLADLGGAFERFDNRRRDPDELAAVLHHAIEQRTFVPERQSGGVHLVDRSAARFGDFDRTYLVGLVDTDWSDRPRRNVLYSAGLLKTLGWPQDADQVQAQQAAFLDMLTLARDTTRLSAFQLDGDAVVGLSPIVELARTCPRGEPDVLDTAAVFPDEVLTRDRIPEGLPGEQPEWWAWRRGRPPLGSLAYSGFVGPRTPEVYRVSRVDRYVTCPFKYFAAHILDVPEDRRVTSGLTPLERGTLLHALFERFYAAWQDLGHGAIDAQSFDEAVRVFTQIARDALSALPEADRVLEEMRLLGSLVTRGVAERVFDLEVASRLGVARRLLEVNLDGAFVFPAVHGLEQRDVRIRAKADRVDVLDDGSLRVVDYKLGRMPDLDTSLQVAVYAFCAKQRLDAEDGTAHAIQSAAYLAFGDDRRLEGKIGGSGEQVDSAVSARAMAFTRAIDRIEDGAFPPRPATTAECQWCGFSGVCRKEYRLDDEEPAE